MRLLRPLLLLFGGMSIVIAALSALMLHLGTLSVTPSQQLTSPLLQLDLEGKVRAAQDLDGLKAACQLIIESYRAEATCKQTVVATSTQAVSYGLWAIVIWCLLSAFVFLWAFIVAGRNQGATEMLSNIAVERDASPQSGSRPSL
jgi:hypothetical protein